MEQHAPPTTMSLASPQTETKGLGPRAPAGDYAELQCGLVMGSQQDEAPALHSSSEFWVCMSDLWEWQALRYFRASARYLKGLLPLATAAWGGLELKGTAFAQALQYCDAPNHASSSSSSGRGAFKVRDGRGLFPGPPPANCIRVDPSRATLA